MPLTKKFIKEQEEKLKAEKEKIQGQLKSFAKESPDRKGDWEAKMPVFNAGSGNLEEEADEVEEFSMALALEHNLEKELSDVNLALEKIKTKKYGLCEKCLKPISKDRLSVYPKARQCAKCK